MSGAKPVIAIIGAGIGGLAAAIALRRIGLTVTVYEQAARFARVGAGIQQSPNAVKVLRALGVEAGIAAVAFVPQTFHGRQFDTGEIMTEVLLGATAEQRYGAPYFLLHRGDLHGKLVESVPASAIVLDRRLVGLEPVGSRVRLVFADGQVAEADAVIGADGVHSIVRELLFGHQPLRYTGRVAYRATFPAARLHQPLLDDNAKWWGPDRHIVIYYTTPNRDEVYFVTALPEPEFDIESWSSKGDLDMLRRAYAAFHPQVIDVLGACAEVYKWALVERDPMPQWSQGRVTLLGDACHPMTPWMAQGAAMSVEDAAILARCLDKVAPDGWADAFVRYERTRKSRTDAVQRMSGANTFLRGNNNPDWVYGYDPITAPLAESGQPALT